MNINVEDYRSQNKNKDFTLITRDCIGGVVYHQLGLRFLSPTINLFFTPDDFNYFCLHLKKYINGTIEEIKEEGIDYPLGLLTPKSLFYHRPIKIHFMHYDSFEIAKAKWEERKLRINYKNLFVVSSFCYPKEVATFTPRLVKKWNKIKFKKLMLVDKKYGFKNEFIIKKPEKCTEYAWLLYQPDKNKEYLRTFNEFDFIKFLNNK